MDALVSVAPNNDDTRSPVDEAVVDQDACPVDRDYEAQRLIDVCRQMGIDIDRSVADQQVRYLELVLEKNKQLNLTAIRDWDKAVVLHLADSLTLLPEFAGQPQRLQDRPFLDMGCGAGMPGIPLALACPSRKGMLCDSVKKKILAVDSFIKTLGLDNRLTTSSERLETLGAERGRSFGCVVARAVAPLAVLVEYAAPLLTKQGQLIVSKGVPTAEERDKGALAAKLCGLEIVSERSFSLPGDYGQRLIITYQKASEPSVRLPRPIGMATKKPLG